MIKECTVEEAIKLRKQIVLNSLYLNDYENDLGIDRLHAASFFDGFVDYIQELAEEDGIEVTNKNFMDVLKKYDTDENLERWWDCFELCPLLREVDDEDEIA